MFSLHNLIIDGGDLKTRENIDEAIEMEPDELYFNNYAEFSCCQLCKTDCSNSNSNFRYVFKCPYKNKTLYNRVKLKMCYSCLKLGLHIYFLNKKRFPKLRNEGMEFHNLLISVKKDKEYIENLKNKYKTGRYAISYNIPLKYHCDYYSKFGDEIKDKLIKKYGL